MLSGSASTAAAWHAANDGSSPRITRTCLQRSRASHENDASSTDPDDGGPPQAAGSTNRLGSSSRGISYSSAGTRPWTAAATNIHIQETLAQKLSVYSSVTGPGTNAMLRMVSNTHVS